MLQRSNSGHVKANNHVARFCPISNKALIEIWSLTKPIASFALLVLRQHTRMF